MLFQKGMDIIFCCNVLIYFDLASKRRVVQHFIPISCPGLLFLDMPNRYSSGRFVSADPFPARRRTANRPPLRPEEARNERHITGKTASRNQATRLDFHRSGNPDAAARHPAIAFGEIKVEKVVELISYDGSIAAQSRLANSPLSDVARPKPCAPRSWLSASREYGPCCSVCA